MPGKAPDAARAVAARPSVPL